LINSFKFWKVHKKLKIGGDKDTNAEEGELHCSICIANIMEGQMARELPCGHIFHKSCVDSWLKNDARCPLDNKNLKGFLS